MASHRKWRNKQAKETDDERAPLEQPSLLPIPSQEQPTHRSLMTLPHAFPTLHSGAQDVHPLSLALREEEALVSRAPQHNKPRPLIPRYRAINGLISVMIVFTLLCGATGYSLQANGKLAFFQQILGNKTPPRSTVAQPRLPVPEKRYSPGPAWNKVIISAAISDAVDEKTNQVLIYRNEFTIGQTFYLTCGVKQHSPAGQIIVKLYTNGNFYKTLDPPLAVKASTNNTIHARIPIAYFQPAEGKAEIYWANEKGENLQLAVTIPFVVQPLPSFSLFPGEREPSRLGYRLHGFVRTTPS